jgi:hypothetical protein
MKNTHWLIVDTETDGLTDPIHVVEIAAQRMHGWEPVGEKFRVLLNHNIPNPRRPLAPPHSFPRPILPFLRSSFRVLRSFQIFCCLRECARQL